ncbi:sulfatase-like hydrolase/transferase [Blastopirellula sp. JC732]|uniref:Sulfatase-like hydrolase/transferase n=1 Tax=Blastopirellula sediminis TaxID=2894196 RepID=A0A9X1MJM9_9BACT|nr:sulfatase-like hydrolase/transferase [Blastopirellula sediminis]MCC9608855.1 sulfatase-like hydrolase/transferase [Blastopirellula sediminis]MCC9628368.1 sulfatase-like hydrolase/transferase [Blastopirellula sediminis]
MRKLLALALLLVSPAMLWADQKLPNILWISSEDNGPQLGCYGDKYADTPNLDALAAKGMKYLHCWSNAPVCAPARTTIISGIFPPATGGEHMRSETVLPAQFKMFPVYLRQKGYYCTNNSKEDYNLLRTGKVWDQSSNKAHWRGRDEGQPFFSVFNFTVSHESQIRKRPHTAVHDPAKAPLPAYHPDLPEVRQDWAQYYDNLTTMDAQAGRILQQLKEDGLEEDTIILYWGDHGSGMPRSKRTPVNSGLQVPLIVHVPEKWKSLAPSEYKVGGDSERLVSFIDLAPTMLSLASVDVPEWMQGVAFMGAQEKPAKPYMYGFRGRMDERYDMVRSCSDGRYVYVRNFMPYKPHGQVLAYQMETPTTRLWREMFLRGETTPVQSAFWQSRHPEELYDLQSDKDETVNLAGSAEHAETLKKMRAAIHDWQLEIRDIGFLPEGEIHSRSVGSSPYEMGHDPQKYPLEKIQATAEMASMMQADNLPALQKRLKDDDSAVRYWGAFGVLMLGQSGVDKSTEQLEAMLTDEAYGPRVIAAEALAEYGSPADRDKSLNVLIDTANIAENGHYATMFALNAIDELEEVATPLLPQVRTLETKDKNVPGRMASYCSRLVEYILAD